MIDQTENVYLSNTYNCLRWKSNTRNFAQCNITNFIKTGYFTHLKIRTSTVEINPSKPQSNSYCHCLILKETNSGAP